MTENKCPLLEGDLEAATHLCLEAAAAVDVYGLFPIGGDHLRYAHHARRHRFETALAKLKSGTTALGELGLEPDDCAWAAACSQRAVDPEGWLARFRAAHQELQFSLLS